MVLVSQCWHPGLVSVTKGLLGFILSHQQISCFFTFLYSMYLNQVGEQAWPFFNACHERQCLNPQGNARPVRRTCSNACLNDSQLQPHLLLYYTACAIPYVCLTLPSSHVKFANLREFIHQGMTLGRAPATKPLAPPSGSLGQWGCEGRALGLQPGAPIKSIFIAATPQWAGNIPFGGFYIPEAKPEASRASRYGARLQHTATPPSLIYPWSGSPLHLTSRRKKTSQVFSKELRQCHLLAGSDAEWPSLLAFRDLSRWQGCSRPSGLARAVVPGTCCREFTWCSAKNSQNEFSQLSLLTEINLGKFHLLILSKNSLGKNVFLLVLTFNPAFTK